MKNNIQIDTSRLMLRKLDRKDLLDVFNYRSLKSVSQYQSFLPTSLEDMEIFYRSMARVPNIPNTWFQLAIILKNKNILIGDIGIHFLKIDNQVEIGYTLSPNYQGQGYAFEAVSSVITYLFSDLKKEMIIASVDKDNIKSINLLHKLGFKQKVPIVGENLNSEYPDDYIFILLKYCEY